MVFKKFKPSLLNTLKFKVTSFFANLYQVFCLNIILFKTKWLLFHLITIYVLYDMLPKSDENRNKIASIRVVLIVLFLIYVDLAVTAVIKLF